jgi:hypothetical protein
MEMCKRRVGCLCGEQVVSCWKRGGKAGKSGVHRKERLAGPVGLCICCPGAWARDKVGADSAKARGLFIWKRKS